MANPDKKKDGPKYIYDSSMNEREYMMSCWHVRVVYRMFTTLLYWIKDGCMTILKEGLSALKAIAFSVAVNGFTAL